ncbi:hypothetical protein CMV_026080 [Castanea mollissima]|uniref:Uncharacterized protein n=1 Tax=Castanea mollissima TaxID=60419 RepID=A0A8J4QCD5_9ROSI|nr:hypothetical protein CMV_026080 [Castanea mollissima]
MYKWQSNSTHFASLASAIPTTGFWKQELHNAIVLSLFLISMSCGVQKLTLFDIWNSPCAYLTELEALSLCISRIWGL